MLNSLCLKLCQTSERNLRNNFKPPFYTKPNCSRRSPTENHGYNNLFVHNIRTFHTTPPKRIPPLFLFAIKSVGKVMAILTGRGFRKWWANLPVNRKQYFLDEFKKSHKKIIMASGVSLALMGVYYQSHIQETPITKRKRFVVLTKEQFDKVADFQFQLQKESFQDELAPVSDPAYRRVGAVIQRLLNSNVCLREVPNRVWSVSIIDSPERNAFVLPGGQIFVHRGMLDLCPRDDQLGIILAHELAHCLLEHGVEHLSYSHLLDFAIIVVLGGIWALMPSDLFAAGAQLFFNFLVSILLSLPYSRKLETEADEVGLQLAARACMDIRESSAFWANLALLVGEEGQEPKWLSTHPRHESRSEHLDAIIPQALELREKCGCPSLPRADPRSTVPFFRQIVKEEMHRRKTEPSALIFSVPEQK